MEVRFKITGRELFVFSLNNFWRSAAGLISIACTVGVLLFLILRRDTIGSETALILVALVIGAMFVQVASMRGKAGRRVSDQDSPSSQEMFFRLDKNGIRVRQGENKGQASWDQIKRVKRAGGVYMLYLSNDEAYLFPERVFRGAEKQKFLRFLEQYVPAAKRRGIRV